MVNSVSMILCGTQSNMVEGFERARGAGQGGTVPVQEFPLCALSACHTLIKLYPHYWCNRPPFRPYILCYREHIFLFPGVATVSSTDMLAPAVWSKILVEWVENAELFPDAVTMAG